MRHSGKSSADDAESRLGYTPSWSGPFSHLSPSLGGRGPEQAVHSGKCRSPATVRLQFELHFVDELASGSCI
jgi:hypothetical protein